MLALMMAFAMAQDVPTQYLEPGDTAEVTVPSILLTRTKAEELLTLATVGRECSSAVASCKMAADSLRACAADRDLAALQMASYVEAASKWAGDAAKMKRQRNLALGLAGGSTAVTVVSVLITAVAVR